MFTRTQRRAIGITAACAAVAMTFGMVSPAYAAEGTDLLVLTPEQVDDLTARAQADVYRDGPAGATTEPDAATTGAEIGTGGTAEPGTEPEASDGGNELLAETEATTWKHTVRASVEGNYGMAVTAPVAGGGDDYFAIDSLGMLQRRTADGAEVWRRDNTSWYTEWGVKPARPWQLEPFPARIVVGYNAISPFTPASEDGFATGDLTGDGVADLVFSASVGASPYRPMQGALSTGTFVTIVDGADGHTLWSKLYAAIYSLELVDGTLVVADSPYFNINAPSGSKMTMSGLTFAPAGDELEVASTWTYDPDAPRASGWADLEPIGDGLLAASWDRRKDALATMPSGNTLVIDTATGEVEWTATDRLYSRQLRLDASRDRLVALEQSDPNEGVQYQIVSYALDDGAREVLDTRVNAMPLASAIGDLGGSTAGEIVVNEATLDGSMTLNATTTRALDGDSGSQLWSRTLKRDPDNLSDGILGWGVQIADGRVIVNYRDDAAAETADNRGGSWYGRITALAGNNGAVKWEHTGTAASQLWSQVITEGKGTRVRTVDTLQNVRTFNLGSGKEVGVTPLPADSSSATAIDITGDGADDLVVGGNSQGVFAYDGRALVDGERVPLWTATVPGSVHKLVLADVTGDGRDEIVVAADTAAAVIDASSGKVLRTFDGDGQFVRTVAAADLDDDGKAEVVLSTDAVHAYHGDGKLAWSYAPQDGVVFGDVSFGDGRVYAEYETRNALALAEPGALGGVALDGDTGAVVWETAAPATPTELGFAGPVRGVGMRAATFASPEIPYADGHAVVFTWTASAATPGAPPKMFMEIRDGRTGEVLHTASLGGVHNLNNWVTAPEGLVAGSTAAFRTFGANGDDAVMLAFATLEVAGFATTPSGERILVASTDGGMSSLPASALVNSPSHVSMAATVGVVGGRELALADLDGDGRVEMISLNFDARGADRTAGLHGSAYSSPFTAMRQFVVATVDAL
ncbi:FG-GAP-like repeat-containing protein [Agromyces italicus]|nr:FG-GAP-like repeat-containing protein [Agromyces italicus]